MLMNISKLFVSLTLVAVLSGCGHPSKEDMQSNPALFDEYFDKCDSGKIKEDKRVCQDVVDILAEELGNIFGF